MKKVTQASDDLLLDFLDGNLDSRQLNLLKDALQSDQALRERLDQLKLVHEALRTSMVETPSAKFTDTVISRIEHAPATQRLSIRNGLFLLAGIFAVLSIAVTLLASGVFDQTTTIDLNNVGLAQRLIKQTLPSFSIDGKLMVNCIIILNIIAAFLVLDRAVLKPFFERRMENAG